MELGEWMKVLLSLTLSGTLLLIILFALKRMCRTRVSKCWQYYILLAAALRFLVPFPSNTALVGRLFMATQNAVEQAVQGIASQPERMYFGTGTENAINMDNAVEKDLQSVPNEHFAVSGGGTSQSVTDFWTYVFFLWFAFALMFFMRKVTIYQSFLRYVKAANQEVSDLETLNLLSDCAERLHIRRTVGLYKNPLTASPMAVGFFHPCIILPERAAGAQELSYIFTHELTHLKRWDLAYKWVVQIVVCVHWFNPFVYLLEREATRACELSCDEAVIHTFNDTEKKAYGDMLLLFLKTDNTYKSSLASVTLTEGAKELKERLGAIKMFHKKSKAVTAVTIALTVLVCACFQTLGVYAMQGREKEVALEEKTVKENPVKEEMADEALTEEQKVAADGELSLYDSVLYDEDENAYYILCDGAQMIDIPDSSFSDGTIGIVLVKKDGYMALGPFMEGKNLVAQVKRQLDAGAAKGYYTQKDMEIALKAAGEIEASGGLQKEKENEAGSYTYVQSGYYQKPFMIVMAYCTSTRDIRNFLMNWGEEPDAACQRQVTLTDGSKMTVYFMEEAERLCQEHPEAYAAVGMVIHRLNTQDTDMQVRTALVQRIDYVEDTQVADYVRECYEKEDIIGFSGLFSTLEETQKPEYYDKIYDAKQTAFFSVAADEMNAEQIALYADKAYQEDQVAFFSILCDRMNAEQIQTFVKRSYEQEDIAKFSIAVSRLPREAQKEWLLRAQSDKKTAFAGVLRDELEELDGLDALDAFEVFRF